MKKFIFQFLFCFFVGIVGGIFADQILWPYFVERPLFFEYELERPPVYISKKEEVRIQENVALREAIKKVEKSVVGVKSKKGKEKIEGSGLILTSDGLVVTLSYLVPMDSESEFFVEGREVPGKILKRKKGLALIKLSAKEPLSTRPFKEEVNLGERVFLLGKIFFEKISRSFVNQGIVRRVGQNYIRTNISEKKEILGSPLFDIEGKILGINVLDSEGRVCAIPSQKIKKFLGF